jgi:hypothetical protein
MSVLLREAAPVFGRQLDDAFPGGIPLSDIGREVRRERGV